MFNVDRYKLVRVIHVLMANSCLRHIGRAGFLHQKSPNVRLIKTMSSNYAKPVLSPDHSSMVVHMPGWSLDDINIVAKDLTQSHYLRSFRVLNKWEMLREIGKAQGFLDLLEFEKLTATYMKCVNLERKVSLEDLSRLAASPYACDLRFESKIGQIGKSSFQIDNFVCEANTGLELFCGSLVYVTVDYKTKRPIPNPQWWVDKFLEPSRNASLLALRVNVRMAKGEERVLHRSSFVVRSSEVDRFGHTNNTVLNAMCTDALLETFEKRKLPSIISVEEFERNMKSIDVDFVGGSYHGDKLDAVVSLDAAEPKKIFCRLYNKGTMTYAIAQEYDTDIWTGSNESNL